MSRLRAVGKTLVFAAIAIGLVAALAPVYSQRATLASFELAQKSADPTPEAQALAAEEPQVSREVVSPLTSEGRADPSHAPVAMQSPMNSAGDFQAQYQRALDRQDFRYAAELLRRYRTLTHAGAAVYGHAELRQDIQLYEDFVNKTPELLKENLALAEDWFMALASLRDVEKLDALTVRIREQTTFLQDSKKCLLFYRHKAAAPADINGLKAQLESCLSQGSDPYVVMDYIGAIIESGRVDEAKRQYESYRERFASLPEARVVFSRIR
jgi:hypothetical protein